MQLVLEQPPLAPVVCNSAKRVAAQCIMATPALDDDLSLAERVKDFPRRATRP
jgi:flagellar assembly factor FliW